MQKQPNSKMCFVCGRENPSGLHAHFYATGPAQVQADYVAREEHQGFPGVMHGGLVTTLLDELIGRAAIAGEVWCVTAKLDVRFRKPVPIGHPLKLSGKITKQNGRVIEGYADIRSVEGTCLAEAFGTYVRISDSQLAEYQRAMGDWRVDDDDTHGFLEA